MSKIEFVSSEKFPEDEYTKEIVYLCLEGKFRVAYVRKSAKNGGMFWSVASIGATKNGKKEFYEAFIQDSNFVEKDIKNFLDSRAWESKSIQQAYQPRSMDEVAEGGDLPF